MRDIVRLQACGSGRLPRWEGASFGPEIRPPPGAPTSACGDSALNHQSKRKSAHGTQIGIEYVLAIGIFRSQFRARGE
jgi:hypothetical protein